MDQTNISVLTDAKEEYTKRLISIFKPCIYQGIKSIHGDAKDICMQDNTPDKRNMCGQPGINLVRNDPNMLYGVNCYGVKPEPKGDEKIKQVIQSDAQLALNAKIAEFQKNMKSMGIAPWNQNKWSE